MKNAGGTIVWTFWNLTVEGENLYVIEFLEFCLK